MNKVAQVNDEGASRCPSFLAVMRCTALYRFLRMLVKQCETSKQDWLVVWNMFYFPYINGNTNPN